VANGDRSHSPLGRARGALSSADCRWQFRISSEDRYGYGGTGGERSSGKLFVKRTARSTRTCAISTTASLHAQRRAVRPVGLFGSHPQLRDVLADSVVRSDRLTGRSSFVSERRGGYLRCRRGCPTYTLIGWKGSGHETFPTLISTLVLLIAVPVECRSGYRPLRVLSSNPRYFRMGAARQSISPARTLGAICHGPGEKRPPGGL